MNFRTEIGIKPDKKLSIGHDEPLFMIGSCFTDNVGALLERDGFSVVRNPMGPLYNPVSILNALSRFRGDAYSVGDLTADAAGAWHCTDFASRYQNADASALVDALNGEARAAADAIDSASVAIVTLGTAYVYEWKATGCIVGNCHKFPAADFNRRLLSVDEVAEAVRGICGMLEGKKIIFTVSPIRHIGDGLHGNQVSKATLLLGLEKAKEECGFAYFPAYEIMMDDLRDYRFYASDMKHPSDVAIDYIYENFTTAFISASAAAKAKEARAAYLRSMHRPLL